MLVDREKNNFIVRTSNEKKIIELWSKKRLPFEPKEWLIAMRNRLKTELKTLEPCEDSLLYAKYVSEVKGFFDVENILFYNVGASSFSKLCQKGLSFERIFSKPPELPNERPVSPMEHYQCYTVDMPPKSFWRRDKSVAVWSDVKCPKLRGDIKPHLIWYEMKKRGVNVNSKVDLSEYYGIDVNITVPSGTRINLANFVKPILDGITSAFHYHGGGDIIEAARRLAIEMGKNMEDVIEMLLDPKTAVLGRREKLLSPYRQGVKWDPADEVVVFGRISLENSNADGWAHSGEMYTVKEQV